MPQINELRTFRESEYNEIEVFIDKTLDEYNSDVISEFVSIKLITNILAAVDMRSALKNSSISDAEILALEEPLIFDSPAFTANDRKKMEMLLLAVLNAYKSGTTTRFTATRAILGLINAIDNTRP